MSRDTPHILLVEDNEDHAELIMRALGEHHDPAPRVTHVKDGVEALDCLFQRGAHADTDRCSRPDVVFLDLRLPRVDGLEVLRTIKTSPQLRELPVVVLTTSEADKDVAQAYENYANAYVVKPIDFDALDEMVRDAASFWLAWNRRPEQ
jgi:CheY-like chemotaxis protein